MKEKQEFEPVLLPIQVNTIGELRLLFKLMNTGGLRELICPETEHHYGEEFKIDYSDNYIAQDFDYNAGLKLCMAAMGEANRQGFEI